MTTWTPDASVRAPTMAADLAGLVLGHARMGIAVTDANQQILFVNPAFTRVTGYTAEEAIGKTPRLLQSGRHSQAFYDEMWTALGAEGYWQGEIFNRRKSGIVYPEWLSIVAVRDSSGQVSHYFAMFADISDRKRIEEALAHRAMFDDLTDLPNRHLFQEHLQAGIAMATRTGSRLAVLFLDLDGFKQVNDSFGHDAGDLVLQQIARRLRGLIRSSDGLARHSGDEFTLYLNAPGRPRDILRRATTIRAAIRQPVVVPEGTCILDASIGIAIFPDEATTEDALLRLADERMYARKRRMQRRRGSAPNCFPRPA